MSATVYSRAPGTTREPYRHVTGITDALQPLSSLHAGAVVAAVLQLTWRWPTFIAYRHIAVVTVALHIAIHQRAGSMPTARVVTALIGNTPQTHCHVARIAVA
jgi:hypothetical protein